MTSGELDGLVWLEPWSAVDERHREGLERELQRELIAGHVLFGREVRAVGRRHDRDDVLFAAGGPSELAVVHLTYAREATPDWPHAMLFASVAEFVEGCMRPDHDELTDDDI